MASSQTSVFISCCLFALANKNQLMDKGLGAACGLVKKVLPESGFLFLISFNSSILWLQMTVNYPYFPTSHPNQDQRQVWLLTSPGRLMVRDEFCVRSRRLTVPVQEESGAEG